MDFPIVGIGASAGGLEALEAFLVTMPPDTGIAFVIVQHLSPKHKSLMAEILQRSTRMRVVQIEDGMKAEPNHVYLNIPDKETALFKSVFHLVDTVTSDGMRLPIDYFFRSLSEDMGEKAICIVLSGTGSDGTLGVKAIKGNGGMSMVQEEQQAKYAGMPQSAIETGLVDFVLPVEKMPEELIRYVKHPYIKSREESLHLEETEEASLDKILMLIRSRAGVDFTGYKHATIFRRIQRRMAMHQIERISDYFRFLQEKQTEVRVLFKDLLIGVTSFFRDPKAFEILKNKVIPRLLEQKRPDSPVRIWVAGCSTGEEAISIAILMEEKRREMDRHFDIQIFATDVDPDAVEFARAGKYPESIVADVPAELLEKYFTKEDKGFKATKKIREMVVYAVQNLAADPPFSRLDLISCRNLLIYFDTTVQQKIFQTFYYTLNQGGYLFLGSSESIGEFSDLFSPTDTRWKFYQRKGVVQQKPLPPPPQVSGAGSVSPGRKEKKAGREIGIRELAEKQIISQYAPACVFVDGNYDVLYFQGATHKYLVQPGGELTSSILKMARRDLQAKLAAALNKAFRQKIAVVSEGVQMARDEGAGIMEVDVIVQPVREPGFTQDLVMVVFEERPRPGKAAKRAAKRTDSSETDPRILSLENELQATKEYLQATIEELETTNEELKSTNEEIQSTNEELTSTNEELETSREELVTMNSELQSKVMQLSEISSDMENLFAATEIGTIFLDTRLNIKRYTPAMTGIFNLIASDVGRPISDITSKLVNYDLARVAGDVLKTLQQRQAEVQSRGKTWFSIRVLPYRTVKIMIDGVVITFVDITSLKTTEEKEYEARALAENIIHTIREPLLILDGSLKVVSANRAFYTAFGTTSEETEGSRIFEISDGQWNIPRLRELLESIIPEKSLFDDFVVEHDFPNIGRRLLILNARMIKRERGQPSLILLAMEDATERKGDGGLLR